MAIHDKTEYTCNTCEKTVIGRKKLQNHMQTHETFDCRKCNSKVKMNSRASHYKKCDGEAVKTFACNKCSYVVDRQDRLAKHMENKHREKEKSKFPCTFCGQGPGGKFNGPSIKYILREDFLIILENNFVEYYTGRQKKS